MSHVDIQQAVTDRVIAALEKGGLAEWTRPWSKLAMKGGALPWNFSTRQPYTGGNVLMLMMQAVDMGYGSNAWLTFNQAKELGGRVMKGSKGTLLRKVWAHHSSEEGDDSGESMSESGRKTFRMRNFTVFHVDQCEGLDLSGLALAAVLDAEGQIAAVEALKDRLVAETGLSYQRVGDQACYSPAFDIVRMPAGEWKSSACFAATLAHELAHATGHEKRLDRLRENAKRFPDSEKDAYSLEELSAEICAAMTCAELGIFSDDLQHESYIDHWLQHLRRDKTYLFTAATLASAAHNYLFGRDATNKVETSFDEAA